MQTTRRREIFTTIRTEGAILPADLLGRVADNSKDVPGLRAEDYGRYGERLNEAISHSWNRLIGVWTAFTQRVADLSQNDPAIAVTRERWLLPLFEELGYGRLQTAQSITMDGKNYPLSHLWGASPIHLVGFNVPLDRRSAGVAGAATMSPHGLVQELLNRSDGYLWGFVSNGRQLRVLRDNVSLTRQAYVEFDLEGLMNGEVYADFVVLWLLCHESRVEVRSNGSTAVISSSSSPVISSAAQRSREILSPAEEEAAEAVEPELPPTPPRPEDCWLEQWSKLAAETGTRVRENLRHGVEQAINQLGAGFLAHPANDALRAKLRAGELTGDDYYRQLLRTVYRLLFLFVAEDRELLLGPDADRTAKQRYERYYSTRRLRDLARSLRGTRHSDLWEGLGVVFRALSDPDGSPPLALSALGSFLWSAEATPDLDDCRLENERLLNAVRELAYVRDANVRRNVDYKNLGSQELGSVYESLLELHPQLDAGAGTFALLSAAGSERKTTGSYYTPDSLVNCLLDTALDPVLEEAARAADPETAILNLKVCDPACGSGHFLIAAAHRIARRLAAVRSGDDEPPPGAVQHALRDVISRCLYGVDVNPMAVELCKVSLWMEALEPGKALSFLDHHIKTGNSLLGATPRLLDDGIPDDAFKLIEGDDKQYVSEWRKRNREQRTKGQLSLFTHDMQPWERLGDWAATMRDLETLDDGSYEAEQIKQQLYQEQIASSGYLFNQLRADTWCAAFVWNKTTEWSYPITEELYRRIERNPHDLHRDWCNEIERLAAQYRFFHWHLAFPDIFRLPGSGTEPENPETGWSGGFDAVMGNPPWEKAKVQEKEWFASRDKAIADARNAASRTKLIDRLELENPVLHKVFRDTVREAHAISHLLHHSGRFPLCGVGDINTYSVFSELSKQIVNSRGYVGLIVPTGIATDKTTMLFFQHLIDTQAIVSFFDFDNREQIFPAVERNKRFSLLTFGRMGRATFIMAAQLRHVDQIQHPERQVELSLKDIHLMNPNTGNCPTIGSASSARIVRRIYDQVPILIRKRPLLQNPWNVSIVAMFHMSGASSYFSTLEESQDEGWEVIGHTLQRGNDIRLPLYESKLTGQFDHRYATFDGIASDVRFRIHAPTNEVSEAQHRDPAYVPIPRYWLDAPVVRERLNDNTGCILAFRKTMSAVADSRSLNATILPLSGVSDGMPVVMTPDGVDHVIALLTMMNSFVVDFVLRQKASGGNLNNFILEQLPIVSPASLAEQPTWLDGATLFDFIRSSVLELTYTAWDLGPFARECGYDGPPFLWNEERRFLLRSELDAAIFHLYGIERDDVAYIMDTFPIGKRKDEAAHGNYRTKDTILQIYDAMAEAARTGTTYQTVLDPPPAHPSLAHDPSTRPAWLSTHGEAH